MQGMIPCDSGALPNLGGEGLGGVFLFADRALA